jgi:predicted SAM-dependent methyltransferase
VPKIVINAGSGPIGSGRLPAIFDDWRQLRLDIDPAVEPDILGDITDMAAIPSGYADAVWSSHCLEHLYAHQVGLALAEIFRVLSEHGFACILVPDLQSIGSYLSSDRFHEVIYESPAGPVTAHDAVFGFEPAIMRRRINMAHHCGFTPTLLLQRMNEVLFAEVILRRLPTLELAAIAQKGRLLSEAERAALLDALEL